MTYTATVSAVAPASGTRTGTVAFQDGGVVIAGCAAKAVAVAGTATCAIAYAGPGTHTITAIYSGDANFTASTASALTQTVNLGADRGRAEFVGQPLEHRGERDVHRQRHGHGTRLGGADRDRRLSGWRRQHRGLQRAGRAGLGEGHMRHEHADRRREHDHGHLQR